MRAVFERSGWALAGPVTESGRDWDVYRITRDDWLARPPGPRHVANAGRDRWAAKYAPDSLLNRNTIAPSPTSQTRTLTIRVPAAWTRAKDTIRSRVLMAKNTAATILAQLRPRPLAQAIHSHSPIAISPPMIEVITAATSAVCTCEVV